MVPFPLILLIWIHAFSQGHNIWSIFHIMNTSMLLSMAIQRVAMFHCLKAFWSAFQREWQHLKKLTIYSFLYICKSFITSPKGLFKNFLTQNSYIFLKMGTRFLWNWLCYFLLGSQSVYWSAVKKRNFHSIVQNSSYFMNQPTAELDRMKEK